MPQIDNVTEFSLGKETVTVQVVEDDKRLNFLPTHFLSAFMRTESSIFNVASQVIKGYKGGYWEYAKIKNKASQLQPFFYVNTADNKVTVTNPFSGDSVEVDDILAGIIVSIYAYNLVATDLCYEYAGNLTGLAYDYAVITDQMKQAFKMLD